MYNIANIRVLCLGCSFKDISRLKLIYEMSMTICKLQKKTSYMSFSSRKYVKNNIKWDNEQPLKMLSKYINDLWQMLRGSAGYAHYHPNCWEEEYTHAHKQTLVWLYVLKGNIKCYFS